MLDMVQGPALQRRPLGQSAGSGDEPGASTRISGRRRITISTSAGETLTADTASDVSEFMRRHMCPQHGLYAAAVEAAILRDNLGDAGEIANYAGFGFAWSWA